MRLSSSREGLFDDPDDSRGNLERWRHTQIRKLPFSLAFVSRTHELFPGPVGGLTLQLDAPAVKLPSHSGSSSLQKGSCPPFG